MIPKHGVKHLQANLHINNLANYENTVRKYLLNTHTKNDKKKKQKRKRSLQHIIVNR